MTGRIYFVLIKLFRVIFLLAMFTGVVNARAGNHVYNLSVRFEPASNHIEGTLLIQSGTSVEISSIFILNKGLKVKSVLKDNDKVKFKVNSFSSNTGSYKIEIDSGVCKNLLINYSGKINYDSIQNSISKINMVKSGLIELSNYVDWYPRSRQTLPFDFNLMIDVPEGFNTVASGLLSSEEKKHGRYLTNWKSNKPVYGISVVSAPGLVKSAVTKNNFSIEVYYQKLQPSYVDSVKQSLVNAVEMLFDLFGKMNKDNLVKIIYSPRGAGGYARIPLIFVSEQFALEQVKNKFGAARDLRLNIHEIAHYWSMADVNSPEDWINEGLAEYSALLISEFISGKEFTDLLLNEYEGIIKSSDTKVSIMETMDISVDREVNRYYKPALLFHQLRTRFGLEKLKSFFRELYIRFNDDGEATTDGLLDVMEKVFGNDAKNDFHEALNKKNWNSAGSTPTYIAFKDSSLLGRWTGPLTQFGSTTLFVLNIKEKDGYYVPTLDSPDQGVKDIPVSGFNINGDEIKIEVGVASATFVGKLNRDKLIIESKWIQRGIEYPLTLKKEN